MLTLVQRASIVSCAALTAKGVVAAFARPARPQGDVFLLVRPFAVGLLVLLAVDVDASDAATRAVGSAFGAIFAEPQPRVPVGSARGT